MNYIDKVLGTFTWLTKNTMECLLFKRNRSGNLGSILNYNTLDNDLHIEIRGSVFVYYMTNFSVKTLL